MSDKKFFGIDFGTTNSTIAFINDNKQPEIVRNPETGELTTPSVVYFENAKNVVVGKVAKEHCEFDSDNVIEFIKREIGTYWQREFFGTTYNPTMITAVILKYLAKYAEEVTGSMVKDVVVTYPAYFGAKQKEALYAACQIANLDVISFLQEPLAAVLSYDISINQVNQTYEDKTVLVYDLGGSTFDSSVLSIISNTIQLRRIKGDHRLGGIDWNHRIMEYLAIKFLEETGFEETLNDDALTRFKLSNAAENAKRVLSRNESTIIPVSYKGKSVNIQLTREIFNKITQDILKQTFDLTDTVLDQVKNAGIQHIDEILLVGGSTLMPQVQDGIKERYAAPMGIPVRIYEPDLAVAKGAAILRYLLYQNN